jgi:hypothetical protein
MFSHEMEWGRCFKLLCTVNTPRSIVGSNHRIVQNSAVRVNATQSHHQIVGRRSDKENNSGFKDSHVVQEGM